MAVRSAGCASKGYMIASGPLSRTGIGLSSSQYANSTSWRVVFSRGGGERGWGGAPPPPTLTSRPAPARRPPRSTPGDMGGPALGSRPPVASLLPPRGAPQLGAARRWGVAPQSLRSCPQGALPSLGRPGAGATQKNARGPEIGGPRAHDP